MCCMLRLHHTQHTHNYITRVHLHACTHSHWCDQCVRRLQRCCGSHAPNALIALVAACNIGSRSSRTSTCSWWTQATTRRHRYGAQNRHSSSRDSHRSATPSPVPARIPIVACAVVVVAGGGRGVRGDARGQRSHNTNPRQHDRPRIRAPDLRASPSPHVSTPSTALASEAWRRDCTHSGVELVSQRVCTTLHNDMACAA